MLEKMKYLWTTKNTAGGVDVDGSHYCHSYYFTLAKLQVWVTAPTFITHIVENNILHSARASISYNEKKSILVQIFVIKPR